MSLSLTLSLSSFSSSFVSNVADPADRVSPEHQQIMLLEIMEEGIIKWNGEIEAMDKNEWLNVGMVLGKVADGDEDEEGNEEEWAWQAYLHDNTEEENQTYHLP